MKKELSATALVLILPLVLCTVLVFHGLQAQGENTTTAASQEIHVDNFSFGPETLTVPVNSTVTWINKDDVPHVIASDAGLFKSKALDTDEKYSYTFTKAGTYNYYCSVHPKMVGKVIVQ